MASILHWLGEKIKRHWVALGVVAILLALLVAFIGGYFFHWDWTGFSAYILPVKDSNFQRGKTLWDWLNLLGVLAIPVVVALGAAWYTAQQGKVSDRENTDNQRETALQAYIDKISELLLHEHLGESPLSPELYKPQVQVIARARTVTILRILDPTRRGSLIRFLSQASILKMCIEDKLELADIDLHGADLAGLNLSRINFAVATLSEADLSEADLSEAYLSLANLSDANLGHANLSRADLSGANLSRANLSRAALTRAYLFNANLSLAALTLADLSLANLSDANLSGSDLSLANLSDANLSRTDLSGADLSDANVTEEQLAKAKSLQDATLPDGSKHP